MSKEIFIPAGFARAFTVNKGQQFRLAQVEGDQVADAIFFNRNNLRERFHAGYTAWLNDIKGIGTIKRITELYSCAPYENVMATITRDTAGVHFTYMGHRCSRMIYRLRDGVEAPPHRTCQDNLAEAIAPFGLRQDDVPDVFNIWMNVDIDEEGHFKLRPPVVKNDDFIDFKAEMDLLVAVSACPNDTTQINSRRVKPLRVLLSPIGETL